MITQNKALLKRKSSLPKINLNHCILFEPLPLKLKPYKLSSLFFPSSKIIKFKRLNNNEKPKELKKDEGLFKLDPYSLLAGKRNKDYLEKLTVLLHSRNDPDYSIKRFNLKSAIYQMDQNNNVCLTLPKYNKDLQGNDNGLSYYDNGNSNTSLKEKEMFENKAQHRIIKRYHPSKVNYYSHESSRIENKTYLFIKDFSQKIERNDFYKNQSQSDINNINFSLKDNSEISLINVFKSYHRQSNKIKNKLKRLATQEKITNKRVLSQQDIFQYNKSKWMNNDESNNKQISASKNKSFSRNKIITQSTLKKMEEDLKKLDEINLGIKAWQIMNKQFPKPRTRVNSLKTLHKNFSFKKKLTFAFK